MATLAQSIIRYRGKDWPLAELARKFGRDRRTLQSRLARGMSIEEALEAPLRSYPSDVKRPKATRENCDRCGRLSELTPCGLVPFLMLCGSCRNRAADIVRRWVGCDP